MSDCCSSSNQSPVQIESKLACPDCGQIAHRVKTATVLHHVSYPLNRSIGTATFYFCNNERCETVYFSEKSRFYRRDLAETKTMLCYCFHVPVDIADRASARDFVKQQTAAGNCACEIRNPSGKCCLSEF